MSFYIANHTSTFDMEEMDQLDIVDCATPWVSSVTTHLTGEWVELVQRKFAEDYPHIQEWFTPEADELDFGTPDFEFETVQTLSADNPEQAMQINVKMLGELVGVIIIRQVEGD